ncbi:hypothetical protein FH972_022762 [Carpinus fangiana]|uniref:Very-long-chain (3R)-3-hydroxyacyl-CoA dehydratase n=1 Tax=Carpinus fangiana TaxID=176857 RepID=A0A5N6KTI3_9ROSI|nr:hypothetical protein FH972_022762 [Carpinus fangiana]
MPPKEPQQTASRAAYTPQPVPNSRRYLIFYNAASLLAWSSILGRVILIVILAGLRHVYPSSGDFVKGVQTFALLEVVHSLVGMVRAPVLTTGLQVASRLFLVWGVVGLFGNDLLKGRSLGGFKIAKNAVGIEEYGAGWNQLAYFGMLVAWSVTECVRYSYFVFFLASGATGLGVPKFLNWARYNFFFVLYPLGISCECWLTYKAIPFAMKKDPIIAYIFIGTLVIYVPGSYILYSHMMAQRKRVMRGKRKVPN